jgi:hypothetical protein
MVALLLTINAAEILAKSLSKIKETCLSISCAVVGPPRLRTNGTECWIVIHGTIHAKQRYKAIGRQNQPVTQISGLISTILHIATQFITII